MKYRLEIKEEALAQLRLKERVEDLEDLRDLNTSIERNADTPGTAWEKVCQEFDWRFENGADARADRAGDKRGGQ